MKNKLNEEKVRMAELAGLLSENKESGIQVWFDMDGVLADFDKSIDNDEELISYREDLDNLIDAEFPDYQGLDNDALKAKLKNDLAENPEDEGLKKLKKTHKIYNKRVFKLAGAPGFFENLELMPMAVEMLKKANEITGKKPNILTAPMGNENNPRNPSVLEKRDWVSKYFNNLVNQVEITTDKGRVARGPHDILIDDRQKYIDKFTNAGGSGILFLDPSSAMVDLRYLNEKFKMND
jgi:5'(3')-deoxyribonucleotidase